MITDLFRVLAVAGAGILLAGCESLSSFQVPSFGLGGPATVVMNLESDPPGAEATLSTGGSCRTPCTLPAPLTGEMTVGFTLPGYQSTTVPVRVVRSETSGGEREFAGTTVTLDPNPVYVELQAVAPAPPPRRRPSAQRPRTSQPSAARPPRPSAPEPEPAPPPPPPAAVTPATPLPPQ